MANSRSPGPKIPEHLSARVVCLAALILSFLPAFTRTYEDAPDRPGYMIGYTAHRTNLPGGQFANTITSRALVVNGDGSGRRELAQELAGKPNQWIQLAGWSPAGRLAILLQGWESPHNGAWEHEHKTFRFTAEHWLLDIVLLDMESQQTTNLSSVERISFYNSGLYFWPRNPNQLGFLAMIDGENRPYRMDRDGKNKKALSQGPGFVYGFQGSPDGKTICYHTNYQLYLADADGGNVRPVKNGHPFHFAPLWSPAGDYLTFLSGEHYNCHPHIVSANGTGLRKLADRGGYEGVVETLDRPDFHSSSSDVPSWSPDGRWLYYTAKVGGAIELMRVTPEGQVEQLTRSRPGQHNYLPKVSPDSKWVAFGSTRSGVRQLYVARADGSDVYALTNLEPGWGAFHPHWRPKKP